MTLTTTIEDQIQNLTFFDAIFVGQEHPTGFIPDNEPLINYVKSGGSVYLFGGVAGVSSTSADAPGEAAGWAPFLNEFGFEFSGYYNLQLVTPIQSSHPVLIGLDSLRAGNGNFISDLTPNNVRGRIIQTVNGEGIFAVYDGRQDGSGLLGDVNLDGDVDFSDIPPFIALLSSGGFQVEADTDQSGDVNFADIPAFIEILLNQ